MINKLISHNENIFVAGGSGMVGSSLCRNLYKSGYGNKDLNGKIYSPTRNELDLLNYADVDKWFDINKPTVVIIAAARVGGIRANSSYPTEFILENLKIQSNLIEIAWKHNVKRLLFLGSSCIYPKFAKQPIKEEYLLSSDLEPTNEWYAIAKIAGIKLCQALRIQYGFDAISLMPTNIYGPGDNYKLYDSHVLPALIKKFDDAIKESQENVYCWGSGKPYREFLHVDDLAKACIFALENWNPSAPNAPVDNKNKPLTYLNVGSGTEISIKDLAELVADESGFKGEIKWDSSKPDGTPRKLLDITKIKSIGWEPSINLRQGIKDTIISFKLELEEKTIRI